MEKSKIGVIHGRFQGLHYGHMEYLLAGKERCEHLFVGITNFDAEEEKPFNEANPTRTNKSSNPFSFFDRYMMVKNSLLEKGIPLEEFDIIPFPIETPEKILNYAPKDATYYVTIYDKWGEKKLNTLNSLGLKTEVMWHRTDDERFSSGSEVRKLIREDNDLWKTKVPPAVSKYIIENNLIDVVKKVK